MTTRQKMTLSLAGAALVWGLPVSAAPYTPKPGSQERKVILDVLRRPVTKQIGKKVTFTEVEVRVQNGWAYVRSAAVDSQGKPVGKSPTLSGGDVMCMGLLRKQGRKWRVLMWEFRADMLFDYAAQKRYPRAPSAIFTAPIEGW